MLSAFAASFPADSKPDPVRRFPVIATHDLKGHALKLPMETKTPFAILVITYKRLPAPVLEGWRRTFHTTCRGHGAFCYYEVGLVGSTLGQIFSPMIENAMRQSIPMNRHDSVLLHFGNATYVARALGVKDKSLCHVYLVDRHGCIYFTASGPVTPSATIVLHEAVLALVRKLGTPSARLPLNSFDDGVLNRENTSEKQEIPPIHSLWCSWSGYVSHWCMDTMGEGLS